MEFQTIRLVGANRCSHIEIPRDASRLMGTLKDILNGDENASEILCPLTSESTLNLVKKYVDHHWKREPAPISKPIISSNLKEIVVESWDVAFCEELSLLQALDLVITAEYLNMETLLDILRALLISRIGQCTRDEIQRMIELKQWPERKDSPIEDLELDLEEDDEQEQMIFLQPSDFEELTFATRDEFASSGVFHLIDILKHYDEDTNPHDVDCDVFLNIPADFYESAARYGAVPRDLICKRKDLRLCGLGQLLSPYDTVLPCRQVNATNLRNVAEYLRHHEGEAPAEIEKPIRSTYMHNITDTWQADFINALNKKALFELFLASNYMGIEPLLHLCGAKVATMIKGKSPEEIQKILSEEEETIYGDAQLFEGDANEVAEMGGKAQEMANDEDDAALQAALALSMEEYNLQRAILLSMQEIEVEAEEINTWPPSL